jgi:hypothetical protein
MHVTAFSHIRCRHETLLAHGIQNKYVSFQLQGRGATSHSSAGVWLQVCGCRCVAAGVLATGSFLDRPLNGRARPQASRPGVLIG